MKANLEIIKNSIRWSETIKPIEKAISRSHTGRKPFDLAIIVKWFILETIYGLSDPRLEEETAETKTLSNTFQKFLINY